MDSIVEDSGYGSPGHLGQNNNYFASPLSPRSPCSPPPPSSPSCVTQIPASTTVQELLGIKPPEPLIPHIKPIPSSSQELFGFYQPPPPTSEVAYAYPPSPILFPSDLTTKGDFFVQVEKLVRSLPRNTFALKWIKNTVGWYGHIVITNKEARRDILDSIEGHFEICQAIDAYLITRDGVCLCPILEEDGGQVSESLVTADG